MPKYVGNWIKGATEVDAAPAGTIKLANNQAALVDGTVYAVYVTSDRGGPKQYAKRWHNWYAAPADILASNRATQAMRAKASLPA